MLNDEKIVQLIHDYNGTQVTPDDFVYVQIEGGIKYADPRLIGTAIFIEGDTYDKAEDVMDKVANVAGKVGSILGGIVGDVADGLDAAADEMATDSAAMILTDDTLHFYVFDKMGNRVIFNAYIPRDQISRTKKSKLLLWHTVILFFNMGGEVKLSITSKVLGIKNQKENIGKFLAKLG